MRKTIGSIYPSGEGQSKSHLCTRGIEEIDPPGVPAGPLGQNELELGNTVLAGA